MISVDQRRARFRELHQSGTFVMPNPSDIGSARLLAALGFEALATTSAGHAGTLARIAHGAVVQASQQLLAEGTIDTTLMVDGALLRRAFTD